MMNFRTLIVVGALGLLGFLLFPRSNTHIPAEATEAWITTMAHLPDEPLHTLPMYRNDPLTQSYDLGFVYEIDRIRLTFKDPVNRGPRRYTIFGSHSRSGSYRPIFAYHGYSSEYRQGVRPFPESVEVRWLQVVLEDWANRPPEMKTDEFRVGARYPLPGPIQGVQTNLNVNEAERLIDGLQDLSWPGAERRAKEKEDGYEYGPPGQNRDVSIRLDLGTVQRIREVRVLAKDAAAAPRSYLLACHTPERRNVYQATVNTPEGQSDSRCQVQTDARFVTLTIPAGEWVGEYVELREIEVLTDAYRALPTNLPDIADYSASLAYYENCGRQGEFSPDLVQGYAYDRGEGVKEEERYLWRQDVIEPGASQAERSFAYHHRELVFRYTQLDPTALYWLRATYLQEKEGKRRQRLMIGPYVAHGSRRSEIAESGDGAADWLVGVGKPEQVTFAVPQDAYQDGRLEIRIARLQGPNAVVSELWLFEAREIGSRASTNANTVQGWAPRANSPPTLDGLLNEWPQLYPLQANEGDLRLYLQWDSENLYVGGTVTRPKGSQTDLRLDRLHLFVDSAFQRSPGMYTDSDHHFVLSHRGTADELQVSQIHHHMDTLRANVPDHEDAESAAEMQDTGYTFEARLPAGSVLQNFRPVPGQSIGFNYLLSNSKQTSSFWATGDRGVPPARWGIVRLVSPLAGTFEIYILGLPVQVQEFSAGDTLVIAVRDPDRNMDPTVSETITVEITGDRTGDQRTLSLSETELSVLFDEDSGNDRITDGEVFATYLPTVYGTQLPEQMDRTEEVPFTVQGGEQMTLRYIDPYYSATQTGQEVLASAQVLTGATGTLSVLDQQGNPLGNVQGTTGTLVLVDDTGQPIKAFRAGDVLTFIVSDSDLIQEPDESAAQEEPEDETEATTDSTAVQGPIINIMVFVENTPERENVVLEYMSETQTYRGGLTTSYGEEPVADDGVLQVTGTQRISAVYTDRIQETGRTNAAVTRQAFVLAGETATLTLLPTIGMAVRDGKTLFSAGESLVIRLEDRDLNTDAAAIEEAQLRVVGDTTLDELQLTLVETAEDSGRFFGSATTQYAATAEQDEVLQVIGNEAVSLVYVDAIQGTGATQVPVQVQVWVDTGVDGSLSIVGSDLTELDAFNAGDSIWITVIDPDEVGESIDIRVEGSVLGDTMDVSLRRSAVGTHTARVQTAYAENAVPDDTTLQVYGEERIVATYVDLLRATGETKVAVQDTTIVNVGTTGTLSVSAADDPSVPIAQFAAGTPLLVQVGDADLNANSSKIETVRVVAEFYPTGNADDIAREQLEIVLRETNGNSSVFEGALDTQYGTGADLADAAIQVQGYGSVAIVYTDAIQDTGRTQVRIPVILGVATGQTGLLELRKADDSTPLASLSAGDRVLVKLTDRDLNLDSSRVENVEVMAQGNVLQDQVSLRLTETEADSAEFWGYLDTQDATRAGQFVDYRDALLQIRDKEVIRVSYEDGLTSTGEPNQMIEARALVASSSAGILLIVDETGTEIGEFAAGQPLFFHLEDLLLTTAEQVTETTIYVSGNRTNDYVPVRLEHVRGSEGLFEGMVATRYGTAPTYDEVLDVQGGETIRATYRPDFLGIPGLEVTDIVSVSRGTRGKLLITRSDGNKLEHFIPGERLYFRLEDRDLNTDPFAVEWASIQVGTQATGPLLSLTLEETSADSGIFAGSLETAFGQSQDGLGLSGGEVVGGIYRDALVEIGETNVLVTDTCMVNEVGYASFTPEPLTVDGLNNRWDLNNPLVTQNEEAYLWVEWNAENLYLFVRIQDSTVEVPDPTRWYENADALEIHLDLEPGGQDRPNYAPSATKPFIFWFCPKGGGPGGGAPYAGLASPQSVWNYAPPVVIVPRFRDDHYTMEIAIPFRLLGGFDPRKSQRYRRIGFNFVVYRSDGPQIQWAQSSGLDPSVALSQFGTLYFREPAP